MLCAPSKASAILCTDQLTMTVDRQLLLYTLYSTSNFLSTSQNDFPMNQPLHAAGCLEDSGYVPCADNSQFAAFVKMRFTNLEPLQGCWISLGSAAIMNPGCLPLYNVTKASTVAATSLSSQKPLIPQGLLTSLSSTPGILMPEVVYTPEMSKTLKLNN